MKRIALLLVLCLTVCASAEKFKGLAPTPPMGWNSWNTFAMKIDENLVKETAEALIASGMRDAGYNYIVIDDGWEAMERDKQGNLVPDPNKFPGGMKALGDYLHSKGFKFGIHNCAGTKTCSGFPGGRGHEFQDAITYASWGVDYLKYDWCYHGTANAEETYRTMGNALYATGRPIVFSLCEWGSNKPWEWAQDIGHLWRTTGDITNCYDCQETYSLGWKYILKSQIGLEKYAGPDHWNDPDMLVVGYVGWSANVRPTHLTPSEQYTHISLWCLLCSPLLIGCDMTKLDDFTLNLLTNDEVLDVSQDPLGHQAARIAKDGSLEIWAKDLEDGSKAVGLFNRGEDTATVTAKWADLGLKGKRIVRDLWRQQDLGKYEGEFKASVPRHGVVLVRLRK